LVEFGGGRLQIGVGGEVRFEDGAVETRSRQRQVVEGDV
jgi:hypothetical protein